MLDKLGLRDPVKTRWLWLLLALFYAGCGSYLLAQRDTVLASYRWVVRWNEWFRFDLLNLHNGVTAVIAMLLAVLIFAWLSPHLPWFKNPPLPAWKPLPAPRQRRAIVRLWIASFLLLIVMGWRLWQRDDSFLPVVLWLLSFAGFSLTVWLWERGGPVDLSLRLDKWDWAWLLGLLIVGVAVGSVYLLEIPALLVGDEGSFWEAAQRIATGEHEGSFFGLGVYTFPIASSFFQGWVLRLFGTTIWSWRFASVLAGALCTIPLYLLTNELFDRRTAVAATLIMIVSPYFLAFSRLGYNNSQALFPVTLCFYFAVLGIKRSSYFYLWLAGLAAGLGFYTYSAAQLGLIVLVLLGGYLVIIGRFSWRQAAKLGGIVLLAWLLFRLPAILYGMNSSDDVVLYKTWESMFFNVFYAQSLYPDADLSQWVEPITIGTQQLFFEPVIYFRLLVRGVVRSLLAFHGELGRVNEHFIETGLAGGGFASALLVLGSAVALRGWRQMRFALLLLWFGCGVLLLSIANTFPPRQAHMVSVIPVLAIFSAVGLIAFVDMFSVSLASVVRKVRVDWLAGSMAVIFVGLAAYAGLTHYFGEVGQKYPEHFDQFVVWTAVRLNQQADTTLVYVEPEPHEHTIDYLRQSGMVQIGYYNLVAAAVLVDTAVLPDSPNLIVFIPSFASEELVAAVSRHIKNAAEPILLGDVDNAQWGYAITNTPQIFAKTLTIGGAVRSLIVYPVWPVLLALFALLLLGLAWLKRAEMLNRFV